MEIFCCRALCLLIYIIAALHPFVVAVSYRKSRKTERTIAIAPSLFCCAQKIMYPNHSPEQNHSPAIVQYCTLKVI